MQQNAPRPSVILRKNQVKARTGLATSTMYLAISAGTFPAPITLGARSVGWLESEIDDWIALRVEASRKLSKVGGK